MRCSSNTLIFLVSDATASLHRSGAVRALGVQQSSTAWQRWILPPPLWINHHLGTDLIVVTDGYRADAVGSADLDEIRRIVPDRPAGLRASFKVGLLKGLGDAVDVIVDDEGLGAHVIVLEGLQLLD